MKKIIVAISIITLFATCNQTNQNNVKENLTNMEKSEQWDKVFAQSPDVKISKVTFKNRFGITLTGDLYEPKNMQGKLPAIAICGPFGAVKEQSSGLYAQELAKRGFLTIAFDPSFTGESTGEPRNVSSPDINTEDFSAAVDYLISLPQVNTNQIGILGICGWGGIALNAAAIDTRIKATIASTMYNMTRITQNGYFDQNNSKESRMTTRKQLNMQRNEDFKKKEYKTAGGVIDPLPNNAPQFIKDYHDYYKTPRGYHKRSLNSNNGWNTTSALSWLNTNLLTFANEIDNAVLIIHGEKAHSRYMGEDAFKLLQGNNKELLIVPNATHCDLYDQLDKIPFDKIATFYKTYLPL